MTKKGLKLALTLALLSVLTAVLAMLVRERWGTLAAAEATIEARYRTEEQWIGGEIAHDILEMSQHADNPRSSPDALRVSIEAPAGQASPGFALSFTLGGGAARRHVVQWARHVWSPEDYEPLARAALAASSMRPVPATPSTDETTLAALTSPMATVIEEQNQRVSQSLARSMLDADAHEDAALVVGALVVREASEAFWDVRQLLCRMTAHLAMARALRPGAPYGPSGHYADVILAAYSGRAREAMTKLDALAAGGGSETRRAWDRALRIWLTADWRTVATPSKATLLERLMVFRALGWTLGRSAAFSFYEGIDAEPVPDWAWIAFEQSFGTEVGGFARQGVEPELAEAREVWKLTHGRELAGSDLIEQLKVPAPRCVTPDGPRALAWGTWAASLQRHVCHRALRINRYWQHTVALPDQAQKARDAFDARLGKLVLYPFVEAARWHHGEIELESFSGSLNTAVATAAKRPELLTPFIWDRVTQTARYAVTRRRMPPLRPWLAALAPRGTSYDAARRVLLAGFAQAASEPFDVVHERNPWNYALATRSIERRFGKKPTVEQIREVLGQRAEYDVGVLTWMAAAAGGRSPERARLLGEACRMLADTCADLARHLVAARRDQEAVSALQRAFEEANDRVVLTHTMRPLVRYHHDKGRAMQATRVAEEAAATYSGAGLTTMGFLLEWRGDLDGAERHFRQVEERYEQSEQLAGFYRRMANAGHGTYEPTFRKLIGKALPEGLVKLDASRLPSIPTDGVGLSNAGPDAALVGLETGDIVVGVDGWRVRNLQEYSFAANFDWRPDMRLYLWRKGRYMEVPVHVLNRFLPLDLHSHPTRPR